MANSQKKRGLPFFNFNKDGKGVKKEEANLPLTLFNFFKYFPRHFSKMLSVNIAFVIGNLPVFFLLPVYSGYFYHKSIAPSDIRYPTIAGALPFFEDAGPLAPLINTIGQFEPVSTSSVLSTVVTYLAFLAIFTFGPVNVGTTYVIRNLLKGEPVFMWDDMKYSIKRNLRQGIIYGIIDIVLSFMLAYDVFFFFVNAGTSFMNSMFFYVSLVALVFYFFMRFYIYLMMVTFDLSIFKLFKNAMIFAFLGFKRNFMALIGILAVLLVNLALFISPITWSLGIALPFVMTIGICTYIAAYAAWPKIKQIMIDPYYKEETSYSSDDAIMHDVI